MEKTIFEKIFDGELPSHQIYKDKNTMAFIPLEAFSEGHVLVIHKNPVAYIYDMPEKDYLELSKTLLLVSKKVKEVYGPKMNIVQNNIADQSVFHCHFHIIPRLSNDANKKLLNFDLSQEMSQNKMREIAEKLKIN